MNTDYGKQIAVALAAVGQLFEDSSKLLQDCDKTIGRGRKSLFGNEVTRDLSRALSNPGYWMPPALYRYYDYDPMRPGLVTGICICFRDDPGITPQRVEEPLFIIGQIRFESQDANSLRASFPAWALWHGYFHGGEDLPGEQIVSCEVNVERKILPMTLIATALYSIKSIQDVERLFEKLNSATP